jgi:hypothetical protein
VSGSIDYSVGCTSNGTSPSRCRLGLSPRSRQHAPGRSLLRPFFRVNQCPLGPLLKQALPTGIPRGSVWSNRSLSAA